MKAMLHLHYYYTSIVSYIHIHVYHIHFAGIRLDMAAPIIQELLELEKGVKMFDAHLHKEVLVVAPVLAILADNPCHAELANHCGTSAKKHCRMCMVSRVTITLSMPKHTLICLDTG